MLLTHILLCKRYPSANGDLSSDDAIPAEEGGGEDVHGATLAMRHACLAPKQFTNDTFDSSATEDGEGMTTIGSDNTVVFLDTLFKSN
jgi:hypothetical protein